MNREQQLAEAFVGLTDTLAADFDPVVLLDRLAGHCVDIIGADAAGVLVSTSRGELRTMAVSTDDGPLFELFQAQAQEGPGTDCHRLNRPVGAPNLADCTDRWPRFAPLAVRTGYRAAHALPLRVNHQTIGAVSLLLAAPGGLSAADLDLAQALADVAAVALVHWSPDPARHTDVLTRVQ
ncbi:GAF domain-containing protein, partial [Streptomyces sp. NPDC057654]|uniref:GAF domain-containing protein n=1 Tax=Streptomyces sp. NPDC057654 TaxID=3346196 RepID=UPI00369868DD